MAHFENLTLEKAMYGVPGKSFTEVLEGLDSSENYRGTPLESLDAYQRQLKRFGIKVSGKNSDRLEKFFENSTSAALFPEYVTRAVGQGIQRGSKVEDLVATVTKIEARDYRSMTAESVDNTKGLKKVDEGEVMAQVNIRTSPNLISLSKKGRLIVSSYEALRFQKLDLFTIMLRQIGAAIAASQVEEAVKIIENGDGSIGAIQSRAAKDGKLSYDEFVQLWGELSPFNLNTIVAGTDALQQIMRINEFKDSAAGMKFHGTGELCTPMGAKIIHVPNMTSGMMIGLDNSCALEMVQAGEIMAEADKLIDRQLERAGISVISGFARIFEKAAKAVTFEATV
ncbi:phage major capsid protein [Scatolibacter rhodanostii]|uniref:phage major capsid protein n=1 Tax=Scatolibacter rhodanostii TaxID=2014781 RepID=UPI000C078552|nr:phage major capsid protein [Scatolibacter rhodanostii]